MVSINEIQTIRAASAYCIDGNKVGRIGDVYVDDLTNEPAWVTITAGLFGTKTLFAPLAGASLDGDRLILGYSRDVIADAPAIADSGHISDTEQQALIDYFTTHQPGVAAPVVDAVVAEPTAAEPTVVDAVAPAVEAPAFDLAAHLRDGLGQAAGALAGAGAAGVALSGAVPAETVVEPPVVEQDALARQSDWFGGVDSPLADASAAPAADAVVPGAIIDSHGDQVTPVHADMSLGSETAAPMTSPYGGRTEEARLADNEDAGLMGGDPYEVPADQPTVVDATQLEPADVAAALDAAAPAYDAAPAETVVEPPVVEQDAPAPQSDWFGGVDSPLADAAAPAADAVVPGAIIDSHGDQVTPVHADMSLGSETAAPMSSPYGGRTEEARLADNEDAGLMGGDPYEVPADQPTVVDATQLEPADVAAALDAAAPVDPEPIVIWAPDDATVDGDVVDTGEPTVIDAVEPIVADPVGDAAPVVGEQVAPPSAWGFEPPAALEVAAPVAAAGVVAAASSWWDQPASVGEPDVELTASEATDDEAAEATGAEDWTSEGGSPEEPAAAEAAPVEASAADEFHLPVAGVTVAPAEGDRTPQDALSGQFRMHPGHSRETIYRDAAGNILYSVIHRFEELFGGHSN